jgi:hypothetical protein
MFWFEIVRRMAVAHDRHDGKHVPAIAPIWGLS